MMHIMKKKKKLFLPTRINNNMYGMYQENVMIIISRVTTTQQQLLTMSADSSVIPGSFRGPGRWTLWRSNNNYTWLKLYAVVHFASNASFSDNTTVLRGTLYHRKCERIIVLACARRTATRRQTCYEFLVNVVLPTGDDRRTRWTEFRHRRGIWVLKTSHTSAFFHGGANTHTHTQLYGNRVVRCNVFSYNISIKPVQCSTPW